MITIYKELIKNYIPNLKKSDLEKYANNNHISYTENELDIVYTFIQENYPLLLSKKEDVFSKLKGNISSSLYNNLLDLYHNYKKYL